jgi:ubiquinone biosynthesis protein Coq4
MNNSIIYRIKQTSKALFYGIDWGWNPTHTQSALYSVEGFLNQKKSYPKLESSLASGAMPYLDDPEFVEDMNNVWDLQKMESMYPIGSLGSEYVKFMQNLGYGQLNYNLADHIPPKIKNFLKIGIKNHDLIHLLLGLYENNNGKYNISDYHEWVFLSWTKSLADPKEKGLVNFLLFPTKFKSWITFQSEKYKEAMKLGEKLSKTSKDLNTMWLKPYLSKPIDQVRQELGIVTLSEVIS